MTLEEAAQAWEALAVGEESLIAAGAAACPSASYARADTYRRTAEAARIQIRTGVAVCSCCFKPFGEGTRILRFAK